MTAIIIAIVLTLVLYVIPMWYNYKWTVEAHGKGGIWEGVDISFGDFLFCFVPLFNLVSFVNCVFIPSTEVARKKNTIFKRIFKQKN